MVINESFEVEKISDRIKKSDISKVVTLGMSIANEVSGNAGVCDFLKFYNLQPTSRDFTGNKYASSMKSNVLESLYQVIDKYK